MAKNWTVGEAVEAIQTNDKASIQDVGSRFPLFAVAAAGVVAGSGADAILRAIPERVSVRVIESALKAGVAEGGDGEGEDAATPAAPQEAKPAQNAKPAETKPAAGGKDYASMGAYPLYQECKARGLDVKSKQDKSVYIAALEAADKGASKPASKPAAAAAKPAAKKDEPIAGPYDGKSPKDLYTLCKERGITAETKQPASYYVDLLTAADNAPAAGEGDDWGDDEAAAPAAPAAPAKPAAGKGKPAGKPAEKKEEDWDI